MPIPPNITSGTAIEINTLPYTNTQVADFAGVTYELWYKVLALYNGVMGVFGFGDLINYEASLYVESPLGTEYHFSDIANKPVYFPVTIGNVYWFRFEPNSGDPTPANFRIQVQRAPESGVAVGDILIQGDGEVSILTALSPVTGLAKQCITGFPNTAGISGDILSSGHMLLQDTVNHNVQLWSSAFIVLATLNIDSASTIRANRLTDYFFVAGSAGTDVSKIDGDANIADTYTLAFGAATLASNPDDTILYYSRRLVTSAVKRHDLATDMAMADLVADLPDYRIYDMLCLGNGNLIVVYTKLSVTNTIIIKQFDDAGVLINSRTITDAKFGLLAWSLDLTVTFWLWYKTDVDDGFQHFLKINISDLTSVIDIGPTAFFVDGIYEADENEDAILIGNMGSCPVLIATVAYTPPVSSGLGGIYRLLVNPDIAETRDTLYTTADSDVTAEYEIPDPFIKTYFIGEDI